MPRELTKVMAQYDRAIELGEPKLLRNLCVTDLFFLLVVACRRRDMKHQWVLERCDEVFKAPDGRLDLWSRGHYKSSVITFGLTLQDILADPEITIGIFSHTRPIAKGFFRAIKRELESNILLKEWFPDILWDNPKKGAPKWSEDDGLIVKRKGNPKESTLEAWGLVDGQPVSKHFGKMVFDDIVTAENAASPEMRAKTLRAVELSFNLGTRGAPRRFAGTRYHYQDAYRELIDRGAVIPRVHPAVDENGKAVLLSDEELDDIRRDQGPYAFASQYMLEPKHGSAVGFKPEWWKTWRGTVKGNRYIVVDPANSKKKTSDYTAIWVLTASADGNWYVEHVRRARLGLMERVEAVMELHREFEPKRVGYEQYGLQADIDAIEDRQNRDGYRFEIVPLAGKLAKFDRIGRLVSLFEQGKILMPERCSIVTAEDGLVDMVKTFRDSEYLAWPFSGHDDMLDALARITDPELEVVWPKARTSASSTAYTTRRTSSGSGALAAL